jgi:isoleucyl-tRNA synthetase
MTRYQPVEAKVDLPAMEREVLEFWREGRIFEASLARREGRPEWVFYEGPPTANGKPGLHHVEARVFKDMYPRYRTMRGYSVPRKAGWDCHGIPVELEMEKKIGTKTKRDIEAFGIAKFNDLCRQSVKAYVEDWNLLTERIGFWIDLDDAYWTMDTPYIESVWWALKTLFQRGLLYQDNKVTAYCPRCGTPLSDAEVAMGYAQAEDPSIYVRFPLSSGPLAEVGADLLVWTTMPWTLVPATLAVVSPDLRYVLARGGRAGDRPVILAADRVEVALGEGAEIVREVSLDELVGARYRGPFDLIGPGSLDDPEGDPTSWRFVVLGDFVKADEGTGVVHTGAAYGQDDLRIAQEHGVPVVKPVDGEGRFDRRVGPYAGMYVREADKPIIEDLRKAGLLLSSGTYTHTFPFCWRCDTPLIYMARPAWYIRTTAVKDRLLQVNESVNWYPDHIKHGRYGDWLANNVDWALSRERYWGTPLPIWACPKDHLTAVGSLAELSTLAGRDVSDIDPHRPYIDEVTLACPASGCDREAKRVPYLIDVWFDAGAMPYAQWGYRGDESDPAAKELFTKRFPADFIAEGLDQTRGWFYTLMAEAVLLFDDTAYRNVVCLGLLVDREGRKMSKRIGNVVDPWEVIDRFGADALRWFLVAGGSPWAPRRVYLEAFEDIVRRFLLTLWNTYVFFVTYANIDDPDLSSAPLAADRPLLDRWALSQLHGVVRTVTDAMESYEATGAARRIQEFVDDLSNWYVRRSRRRFWDPARSGGDREGRDKLAGYATLHECLTTIARLMAPIAPFVSEALHRNLTAGRDSSAPDSVHLTDFPDADDTLIDPHLDEAMATARAVVSLGRQVRTEAKVRVRQPLGHAAVHVSGDRERLAQLLPLIAEELNVKDVRFAESAEELSAWRAKPNFRKLGPALGPRVKEVAAALAADRGEMSSALARGEALQISLPSGPLTLEPADVELVQQSRTGWGSASDGSVTVALDLEPDEALRREGLVRELIHHVQNLRKSSGLDVTDRIVVGMEADPDVAAAVDAHYDRFASEVLATNVRPQPVDGPTGEAELSVDGRKVRLTLRPA